jgi:hypothetical protein
MIKQVGNRNVPCPREVYDDVYFHPGAKKLSRPDLRHRLFVEVYPRTQREIAFYGSIAREFRCHATTYPHMGQSPLLVEMREAKRLGIIA